VPTRSRYRDLEDDDDFRHSRPRSRRDAQAAARAAVSGLTCSLISLGLLVLILVIWAMVAQSRAGPAVRSFLSLLALVTVLGCFVLSLLGTIFSNRGLDPANEVNRGVAVAGLVCGIIALVISATAGLILLFSLILSASTPTRR
jgi:hypothetical protein